MEVALAVKEFLAAKAQLSPFTRRMYVHRLGVFARWCEAHSLALEHVRAAHVRTFIKDVSGRPGQNGQPVEASTVRQYTIIVKVFLAWVARAGDDLDVSLSPTIAARIEAPKVESKVVDTFTDEEIAALFAAARCSEFAVRDRAPLSILLDTGARASEVVGLMTDCVWLDPDDSYLLVKGKGKKWRELAIGREARMALRRYITRYRRPINPKEQHVFLANGGRPLTVSGLSQLIVRLGKKAEVNGAHLHKFRHSYATRQLLSGTDLLKLSRMMGHESARVTERYLSSVTSRQVRQESHSVLDHLKEGL